MKKILSAIATLVLSVASLAVFAPSIVSAAAPYTCTWTGATNNNFSNAGNWSGCNSAAPQAGDNDNLVFNGSATSFTPTNDISSLSVGNVTFSGATAYTITGVAFTITGGVTDNTTGTTQSAINTNVTFSGNQNISGSQNMGMAFGVYNATTTVTISGGTLTVASGYNGSPTFNSELAGSGTLTVNGGSVNLENSTSSFTGPINIGSGAQVSGAPASFGTGAITVASGGNLDLSSLTNETLNNALTIAGTGIRGSALFSNVGPNCSSTCASSDTLTLAGALTLTGNTTFDPSDGTINVTGTYNAGGFTLTAASGKIVIGSTVINGNGTGLADATKAATAVKTPDTGFGVSKKQPFIALAGALLIGGVFVAVARSNRKVARGRR